MVQAFKNCLLEILKILWILGSLVILGGLLSMGFTNDAASYTRIGMHELDGMGDISYCFIGNSHVYRGIDPNVIETVLEGNTFNAGSSSQRPEDSFYLLKYILERHKVDTVVCNIWYSAFQNYDNDSPIRTHILLDYMDFGFTKLEYALSVLGNVGYALTPLSNIVRYKNSWKDIHSVLHNLRMHLSDSAYLSYDYENAVYPTEWYAGDGFVYSTNVYQGGDNYTQTPWDQDALYPRQLEYLGKIIELCKDYSCHLIFISVPVYNTYIQREPHYGEIYDLFSNISQKNNIPYLDFNIIPLENIGLEQSDFADEVHLNGKGAEKFSKYLGKVLAEMRQEKESNKSSWFNNQLC